MVHYHFMFLLRAVNFSTSKNIYKIKILLTYTKKASYFTIVSIKLSESLNFVFWWKIAMTYWTSLVCHFMATWVISVILCEFHQKRASIIFVTSGIFLELFIFWCVTMRIWRPHRFHDLKCGRNRKSDENYGR